MSSKKAAQASRHRSIQVLLAIFSIMFFSIVAYGYYHLLTDFGWFVALIGGLLMASFAWFLARVAGTGEGGIRANWILILPLFIVSAAGVYNSMMVYLEGSQVLSDTASNSQRSFGMLETAANAQLETSGVARRINEIDATRDALFSEIANPLNCGQGPEARRLISELQRQLPGFQPLSSPRKDCAQNEAVIQDYRQRIDSLIAGAPWNNPILVKVATDSSKARSDLAALRSEISRSYSPENIRQIASIFEGHQTQYQDLLYQLGKETDVSSLPVDLPITSAESLGNVYKLPALIFDRLDKPATYAYLLIAFGFDMLLVYLFQLVTAHRVRRAAITGAIAGAW